MALFSTHVFAINQIYKNTKFQTFFSASSLQTPCFEGINFRILRTTVSKDDIVEIFNENKTSDQLLIRTCKACVGQLFLMKYSVMLLIL